MVFGNKVIDQELVTGIPGAPMEAAAIYEVTEQGISKVCFVRGWAVAKRMPARSP